MTFIYPLLLGGVVLIGIPVLLHLIMRQKPKHLLFPAFRFLLQRHRTNQRKLRLRHLLLLVLRVLLIAGLCLALARPKVFSERINLGGDRPVAAVLVFDTSPSMEYASGGQNRLDVAKRRAQELMDELPDGSRVAVLDTAEPGSEWFPTLSLARDRVADLRLRPANNPVTSRLAEAYRLFADLDQEAEGGDDILPKFLYVFSDRTQNAWDQSRVKDLEQLRDRLATEVHAVFVDVGVDSPADVALVSVRMPHQVIPTDGRAVLEVTVQATGSGCDTEVVCRIEGEKAAERKPIKLAAGQSQVLTFERGGLAVGPHQAEITLATTDALPFNNALFATFEVRGGRKLLVLADEPSDAAYWKLALESTGAFRCDVRTPVEVRDASPKEWNVYKAICLLNVAHPDHGLWEKLASYVQEGGGLAVVPGGQELNRDSYNNDGAAQRLLPGLLVKVVEAPAKDARGQESKGANWQEASYKHPIMAPFREWALRGNVDFLTFPPTAKRYWEVKPHKDDTYVIVSYEDKDHLPALLERNFDPKTKIKGHVLLYTTPLDRRHLDVAQPWNDYLQGISFYLVMVNKTVGYLAGDAEEANFLYVSGQQVPVAVLATERSATFTLQGPGLSAAEALVPRPEGKSEVALTQAQVPGNYTLVAADGKRIATFSMNPVPEESQLGRVPPEQIESLLGQGAVLPVGGKGASLHEALQGRWRQPLELFPWLMLLVLMVLAVENFLANKFYRKEGAEGEERVPAPTSEAQPDSPLA
jgi:hypothetical protein